MGSRGRPSLASLSVLNNPVQVLRRPDPPNDLTDAEAKVWRSIVASMPADWFGPHVERLLVQYCRHVVASNDIGRMITICLQDLGQDSKAYFTLLDQQRAETLAIERVMRSMRLTHQATMRRDAVKPHKIEPTKPWEE